MVPWFSPELPRPIAFAAIVEIEYVAIVAPLLHPEFAALICRTALSERAANTLPETKRPAFEKTVSRDPISCLPRLLPPIIHAHKPLQIRKDSLQNTKGAATRTGLLDAPKAALSGGPY